MADGGDDCESIHEHRVASLAEQLAAQFYEWEQRGRGWLVWDEAVRPEPPFQTFRGYAMPRAKDGDDGRTHTWLSGFVQWLSTTLGGSRKRPRHRPVPPDDSEELLDISLVDSGEPVELQVTLRPDAKVDGDSPRRFLLSLGSCCARLSFEVIGSVDEAVVQVACAPADVEHVRAQLQAYFPEAVINRPACSLSDHWDRLDRSSTRVVEFGLAREFVLPLAGKTGDLLVGLAGTYEQVEEGELALVQVLFEPVRHPWGDSVLRAVATPEGEALFAGTIDLLGQANAKIAAPLFAAVIRVACRAATSERAWSLARHLGRALDALADPLGNELIALDNEGYDDDAHAADVPARRCRRSGLILNVDELAALVHPPTADVRSAKLKRRGQRTRPAPACVLNHELVLGHNEYASRVRVATLSPEQRVRHMHVIGASGTGKSTLLVNMILQDIAHGQGVAVLDPHGDLIDAILDRIPDHRAPDVVLFDPSDEEHPIGLNVLAAHSDAEKTLMASDLIGIFRRLSTSWGDQMNAVLSNAILAFLESDRGGTLSDLRRFLIERGFREEFLQTVRDPHIAYYWRKEFPLLVGRSQGPVLTRLDTFLRPRALRHIVAQRENKLDFADIMDSGKIFLARLAHGAIGEENTYLLGSLLVSKFHQIALGRQLVKEENRRHFWLYVDEFHHFATPSMASLLSGVRKYRLGLVLAHQEMHQLESRSPEVASAILANTYTRVCFRVGDHDARKLKEGFSSFDAGDLQNLGTGEAVCRVERSEFEFNLRTTPLEPVCDHAVAAQARERIISQSRERYATARAIVEAQLRESAESFAIEDPEPRSKRSRTKTEPSTLAVPTAASDVPPAPNALPTPPPAQPIAPPPPTHVRDPSPLRVLPEDMVMGRGGPDHKYLQQFIKQWGDGMGFRSTVEKAILDGEGSIDVALERPGLSIACQISITTPSEWELGSIRKCLKARFSPVILACPDAKHLAKLRKAIEAALQPEEKAHVRIGSPEELIAHIQELVARGVEREQTIRGYKVKRTLASIDVAQSADRRDAVAHVVAAAMKRLRPRK